MIQTSVLIPTKNGGEWLEECLAAVYGQKGVGPLEVLILDSGSTDGTLEIARRYPARIETILAEEFHHARTRNYAASLAEGQYLVFLSQDAIPANDGWLRAMLRNLEDGAVGAVYGRQVPRKSSTGERHEALSALYGSERLVKDSLSRERLGFRYYHFSSANSAMRRDVWKATQFPEELRVFEDLGIAKKILDGGWKIVYEPEATVEHAHNHTAAQLFQRYFDIGYTFRRLGIWNEVTRASMIKDGWKLFRKKFARRNRDGNEQETGASFSQQVAKTAGLFLGLNERYLPLPVKRRLSAFRVYE